MSSKVDVQNKKSSLLAIFSGTIVSIAITLILILIFAVLIRFTNISDKFIFPVNQVIKIISLFIGVSVFLKKDKSKGFLKGVLLGIFYFILSFVVFSFLQGGFSFTLKNLYDLILTSLMGGLIGIIMVNIGRK